GGTLLLFGIAITIAVISGRDTLGCRGGRASYGGATIVSGVVVVAHLVVIAISSIQRSLTVLGSRHVGQRVTRPFFSHRFLLDWPRVLLLLLLLLLVAEGCHFGNKERG